MGRKDGVDGRGDHKMVEEGGQQVGTAVVLAKTQIVPENRSRRQPLHFFFFCTLMNVLFPVDVANIAIS